MITYQQKIWLERAGIKNSESDNFLFEEGGLNGSISGGESYKAISHFKGYVAPYLPKKSVIDAKHKMEPFGNIDNVEEKDGEFHKKDFTHELSTKHNEHEPGTKIKVLGISHVGDTGRIYLQTKNHGIIPQSRIKKPDELKRENKSKAGFNVEDKIAKNLGGVAAGSTGSAYDFSYGKNKDGSDTIRGKTKVINESVEPKKSLKKDEKPIVAGESKLTNVKMGAGTAKFDKNTKKWNISSRHEHFATHMEKNAKVNGIPLLEHLNKNYPKGIIEKGMTMDAPKGTARSYLKSIGANVLHIHDKETDKGTTLTVGNKNELIGKTKLKHFNDSNIDEHFDGCINIESTKTGTSAIYHRPNKTKLKKIASLSTLDPKNHKDLSNEQHANEFKKHIDKHIREISKK
jgi:hypothetical protein